MTYLKPSKTDGSNAETDTKAATGGKSKEVKYKKSSPRWLSEGCIQACAWILLTIGLCIIVITFYLALHQKQNDNSRNFNTVNNDDVDNSGYLTRNDVNSEDNLSGDNNNDNENYDDNDGENDDDNENDNDNDDNSKWFESPQNGRLIIENIFGTISSHLIGCQEKVCKIACSRDGNVFMSLFKTMKSTTCPSIDVLLLESQDFPDGMLSNSWLPLNLSVHEIIIRSSNLTRIKGNAFNSPLFMNTFLMSWSSLNIDTVESGALLGLYKLKYLTIDSSLRKLEPALFQPVQTTLTHLKLNAHLELHGNRNVFGVSYMSKMEYLDMSYNNITGPLGRRMFSSTPNLKYLIMVESKLQHIEENAFDQIWDKLIFVNLSINKLVTLSAGAIEPILQNHVGAMINLSHNSWLCDCGLQNLSSLYHKYRNQFMDAVYCMAPHKLYGTSIDEVNYEKQDCDLLSASTTTTTTVQGPVEEKEDAPLSTTKETTAKTNAITPPIDFDSSDVLESGETNSVEVSSVFKMRCINVDSSESNSGSSSSSSSSSGAIKSSETPEERNLDLTAETDYFQFPPPSYEFDLELIADNNSVLVIVENPDQLMVMWFSEQQEADFVTCNNRTVDYECMSYAQPYLMVGPLVENTTYTFCLVPPLQNSISPFNCQPLHVPLKRQENIWISQDNKQFTIGMLCLIFLVSTIMGALVAYFGIKTYPDLLEGSKNVLVVKKPDKSCYVATISETEYMKQASLKKRKSCSQDEGNDNVKKETFKKQSSIKLPLPSIPFASPPESSPPPFHISVRNLESMSSCISTSPGLDEPFAADYFFKEENYETPRSCENQYSLEQRSVPNNYGMSPGSPPPLPKRNSNISDSPTLVMNRFSKNM